MIVIGSQYAVDSLLNLAGSTLLFYHDPDVQSLVYESNSVPPGLTRKSVAKNMGALIIRSPESVDVHHGELLKGVL